MPASLHAPHHQSPQGFCIPHPTPVAVGLPPAVTSTAQWLYAQGIAPTWLDIHHTTEGWHYRLTPEAWLMLTPGFNTLNLRQHLPRSQHNLTSEILVALLASPLSTVFPTFDELCAHVAARRHTCEAGALTTLAFATETAERPESHWRYHTDTGFTLQPQASLIDALRLATQPSVSGSLYSFSCYRATEYVLLLGLAQTLAGHNPDLLQTLEETWRQEAIASARFHDTFLVETGSTERPLPMCFYTPGDRVWFRNPDEASADVTGFEGSWVVYVGNGRFTDFWRPQSHYTLESKCLEIFHWRHALVTQGDGSVFVDENLVWAELDQLAASDTATQQRRADILNRMMRYRDNRGVYADGGCIDSTREFLAYMCPGTLTINLPNMEPTLPVLNGLATTRPI